MSASPATIRVLVVDDSSSTRGMLREAMSLEPGMEVVGEAATGTEGVELAAALRPDVVLMDVRMPDMDGVRASRAVAAASPTTKIVALTWADDPATVRRMLAAGAIAYVVKGGPIEELYGSIRSAATGEAELDHRVLPAAVEDLRRLLEEERERREQVERLSRSRDEFVAVLSHELRTPLTVISGALRMLKESGSAGGDPELLESAVRRADELQFLVEGLELVAEGPTADGVAHPREAVRAALDRLGAGGEVVVDIDGDTWTGVPHPYLVRIAYELLSNALAFGVPPVRVSARAEGAEGILDVVDAGGWAPPDRSFPAFLQGDMSTTRTRSGFGLGLFVASRLCEACDGSLTIEAQEGATVARARLRLR